MFLPEDYNPSKLITIISLLVLATGITYSIYHTIKNKSALEGESRYTIAYTTDLVWETSGRAVKYIYSVNGKNFDGIATYAYNSTVPGGRYLLKFSVANPEVCQIYQNHPIPDKVKSVPPKGWEKVNTLK